MPLIIPYANTDKKSRTSYFLPVKVNTKTPIIKTCNNLILGSYLIPFCLQDLLLLHIPHSAVKIFLLFQSHHFSLN